jgi:hypothetical protein
MNRCVLRKLLAFHQPAVPARRFYLLTHRVFFSPNFSHLLRRRPHSAYVSPAERMSESPSPRSKVLVFGAGNFGSCLADHLGDSQHDVFIWTREQSVVEYFNKHHRNPRYLIDHHFSSNIKAIGPELPSKEFLSKMDVLLFAIPTQGLRFVVSLTTGK